MNEKGKSGVYSWKTELNNAAITEMEVNRILEMRTEQLQNSYEHSLSNDDEKMRNKIEEEWSELVLEKDRRLKEKIRQDNEKMKQQHMAQLYQTLHFLGSFSFTEPKDVILKRNLSKIYKQVGNYCKRNGIRIDEEHNARICNDNGTKNAADGNTVLLMAPAVPPPPLPPLPPPPPQLTGLTGTQTPRKHQKRQKTVQQIESPLVSGRKPLMHLNDELLVRIKRGPGRDGLKSTPLKRSPGGTPCRNRRRMSDTDTSDFITVALKKKFKNVAVHSPKENLSPQLNSPA